MRTSQAGWGPQGVLGSLCRIRFAGPVFRFGQNPVLGFCFGREVSDMRVRTISCLYRNEPATGFYHFRHKVGDHLGHCRNMRRNGQWRRMAVWPLTRRYPRTFGVGHRFCLWSSRAGTARAPPDISPLGGCFPIQSSRLFLTGPEPATTISIGPVFQVSLRTSGNKPISDQKIPETRLIFFHRPTPTAV